MEVTSYWKAPGDGTRHAELPKAWNGIAPFTAKQAIRQGWRRFFEEHPSSTCTKYEFTKAVQKVSEDLWNRLLAAYREDEEFAFYWNTVQILDRNEARFLALAERLGVSASEIDEVFHALNYPEFQEDCHEAK